MSWVPVELLNRDVMVAAAARRARVRLTSGHIASLVRWCGRDSHGQGARCETAWGSRFKVHVREIADLWVEP